MSSEIVVSAANLGKCYQIYERPRHRLWQMFAGAGKQHYREFWALQNITFEIGKGETVGIIGGNGSGKSTLLQLICGTLTASAGAVHTQGRIAALLELGSGFNPDFTGRENVYMNAAILGLKHVEVDERFEQIASFANIGEFIDQPVRTYSSGMIVRLAFAVSVCVEPDILVVDEALAVGDASFQFKCFNRLESLTQQGTTLLFVSHDMNMVKRFCNRVIYLRNGAVRASGMPDEMAELYLLDMRDEQRRWASGDTVSVGLKQFRGKKKGFAFGTNEGYIATAHFAATQELYSSYMYDEEIEIIVETVFQNAVLRPNISLTIQEARMLVIGGGNFPICRPPSGEEWLTARTTVRFPARLSPGRYHVTVKLLDGYTEETSQLIEKQVALLAFDILPGNRTFLGIVDLGLEQISSECKFGKKLECQDPIQ